MMDSSVLSRAGGADDAAVSLGASEKSISRRMSSVPVESVTDLKTCSTEMMDSDIRLGSWRRRDFIAALLAGGGGGMSAAGTPVILVVGDSLSAEYGLKRGSGWVALLEQRLAREKHGQGGQRQHQRRHHLRRPLAPAGAAGAAQAHARVLELGGNDALRGLPLSGPRTTWRR